MLSDINGMMFSNRRTICFITGAGTGLGRCLSQRFSKELATDSVVVLIGRSAANVEETKKIIENERPNVTLRTVLANLASCSEESLRSSFVSLFDELKDRRHEFEQVIIIHNAGSVGDVSKRQLEINDTRAMQEYWNLSLTSVIAMNSLLLGEYGGHHIRNKIVVNITSLLAIQPFQSMSLYCAGKAARDMLFKVLAEEEPSIRVLNYAPGPLKTDMLNELVHSFDDSIKGFARSDNILTCDQTVDKFMGILKENKFQSGQHIDYFDV